MVLLDSKERPQKYDSAPQWKNERSKLNRFWKVLQRGGISLSRFSKSGFICPWKLVSSYNLLLLSNAMTFLQYIPPLCSWSDDIERTKLLSVKTRVGWLDLLPTWEEGYENPYSFPLLLIIGNFCLIHNGIAILFLAQHNISLVSYFLHFKKVGTLHHNLRWLGHSGVSCGWRGDVEKASAGNGRAQLSVLTVLERSKYFTSF